MKKLLEITVYYMCNPGISSVYFHAISVENTRLHSFNTYVIFVWIACFSPEKTPFNIYVKICFLPRKHMPKSDFSWCKSKVKVGQK